MADEFVWMKHPEGSEAAPFAVDAAEFWQARGWEPVEKPEEPDPTAEPRREAPPTPDERAAETTTGDVPGDEPSEPPVTGPPPKVGDKIKGS